MATTNNSVNGLLIGPAMKTAFGELSVAEPEAQIQLQFPYNINTEIVTTTTAGSGTATQSNSFIVLSTTAAASSSASFRSKDALHYRTGQGVAVLFTAVFTDGAADSSQIIGIGDSTDGFFFGYNGATFGILHRNNTSDTWVAQSSWNKDVMDGTGTSGVTLDPTNGNVYKIQFQWLGFGAINFYIEDQNTGALTLVHQIEYANQNTAVSLTNPSLPLFAKVENTTNATNIVLKNPSFAGFVEGKVGNHDLRWAASSRKGSITTELNVITIRDKSTYASKTNKTLVFPDFISMTNVGASDCKYILYQNASLGGSPSYSDVSTNTSVVDFDVAGTTVSGGRRLAVFYVAGNSADKIDLHNLSLRLNPGETLTVTGQSAGGTGGAITCDVGISWRERL